MKTKQLLASFLAAVMFLSSCSTVRKSASSETVEIRKTDIVTTPQVADLKIEERKIEGVAEVRIKDYTPNAVEACKALAVRNATTNGKCDLIAQPNYEIEQSAQFVKVKVTGFAAHYKNFRAMVPADTTSFVVYEKITNSNLIENTSKTNQQSTVKKGAAGKALLAVLTISLLAILIGVAASA